MGQRVHVQIRLRCYLGLFLIFLSLHKQPFIGFITAESQVITARFVYHCTVFCALDEPWTGAEGGVGRPEGRVWRAD